MLFYRQEEKEIITAFIRRQIWRILPLIGILTGAVLLVYPWASEWLYENQSESEAVVYEEKMKKMEEDHKESLIGQAAGYNSSLTRAHVKLTDPFAEEKEDDADYPSVLWFNSAGVMGYIDIPKISVYLPIYHGTDSGTLEAGIGHLEGSSFPIGGENTHAVLTGHTGLTHAKLFTDLIDLEMGDHFFLHILGETLAYEVSDIRVVLPEEQESLHIVEGEDLVTLVTCTPYGINDHRLLVTGKRVNYSKEVYKEAMKEQNHYISSIWKKSYRDAVLSGIALSVGFFGLLFFFSLRKKRKRGRKP